LGTVFYNSANLPSTLLTYVLYKLSQSHLGGSTDNSYVDQSDFSHKRTHAMKLFTTSPNASHLALLVALALSLFALAGCNTIDGAGKDIERAGEEIQKATD